MWSELAWAMVTAVREQSIRTGELPVIGADLASSPGGDFTEIHSRWGTHSLAHERMPFTGLYQQYRFAFPDRVCALAESAQQAEAELLDRTLAPLPADRLVHPYPADLSRIADAINGLLVT